MFWILLPNKITSYSKYFCAYVIEFELYSQLSSRETVRLAARVNCFVLMFHKKNKSFGAI